MKTYSLFDKPLKVRGIPFFDKTKKLTRLPDELISKLPEAFEHLGRRCPGARVEFMTDSPSFNVKLTLKTLSVDEGMSLYSSQSIQVMVGDRASACHIGLMNPPNYDTKIFDKTFYKSDNMELVTLYFPRNEQVENIEVSIEDGATICEPTPYKYEKPVVFYGSSITEGGCSCNSSNAYSAILSRWLDCDFYNLGFSASAKGEPEMADFINTIDMSVFVYDYDHNAPDIEHLKNTHKPFFDKIRKAHPELPIIMMTRPAEVYYDDYKARREVVKETYNKAKAQGDKNVYFIDGETFYGETDRNLCSFDNCHPNDLGFFRMSCVIRPVLKEALESL